ncbi:hypothetical protein [Clostridium sp. ZBS4]|uniref:hypothetical protein n=1 Tax=Clostridium sp. ZBS4 TaxID=2949974 RepID=UPI0020794285|nr:hypothetical protein [Clostridium sp. ZBS4]
MESKNIVTAQQLIDAIRKNTKLFTVIINNKKIILPIYYNSGASMEYENNYKLTKDSKESFCVMLLDMINNSKNLFKDNLDIQNLVLEDIKVISNDELKKIGEIIINSSEWLKEFFINDENKNFFDNFNTAIIGEHNKYVQEANKRWKKLFNADDKIYNSVNNMFSKIDNMQTLVEKNINKNTFELPKAEMLDVGETIFHEQLEIDKQIAQTLLESIEENKIASIKADRNNKINTILVIFTLIVTTIGTFFTVASVVGLDNIINWLKL